MHTLLQMPLLNGTHPLSVVSLPSLKTDTPWQLAASCRCSPYLFPGAMHYDTLQHPHTTQHYPEMYIPAYSDLTLPPGTLQIRSPGSIPRRPHRPSHDHNTRNGDVGTRGPPGGPGILGRRGLGRHPSPLVIVRCKRRKHIEAPRNGWCASAARVMGERRETKQEKGYFIFTLFFVYFFLFGPPKGSNT